jgi:hypothetical protein
VSKSFSAGNSKSSNEFVSPNRVVSTTVPFNSIYLTSDNSQSSKILTTLQTYTSIQTNRLASINVESISSSPQYSSSPILTTLKTSTTGYLTSKNVEKSSETAIGLNSANSWSSQSTKDISKLQADSSSIPTNVLTSTIQQTESLENIQSVHLTSENLMNSQNFTAILEALINVKSFSLLSLPPSALNVLLSSKLDLTNCIVNCSNNGHCKLISGGFVVCECDSGFIGNKCEAKSSPCSYGPCLNNGTCSDTPVNSTYSCECASLYYGVNCENKINVCENVTCSGNGYCKAENNTASCVCFPLYSGTECEIVTAERVRIEKAIVTCSTLAIIVISLFFLITILSDLFDLVVGLNGNLLKFRYFSKYNDKGKKRKQSSLVTPTPVIRFHYTP